MLCQLIHVVFDHRIIQMVYVLVNLQYLRFWKLPVIEEQIKIANFLSNIDNLKEEEQKNLDDLREMKKGLLQQMFV